MRQFYVVITGFLASCLLALTAAAGTEMETNGKEMKQVAPLPPPPGCDWTGFYIGINAGGQVGHSQDKDVSDYNDPERPWGYSESGVIAGGQMGYNYQWRWLVLGPEFDLGYMNLNGGPTVEPGSPVETGAPNGDTSGRSDSGLYTTLRGRIGVNVNWAGCWLVYATGGAIGANYTTRVDDSTAPDFLHASKTAFDWGYTVGGGVERKIGSRWSVKVEYLYFSLGTQSFIGHDSSGTRYGWRAETTGNMLRAGLNYKFW